MLGQNDVFDVQVNRETGRVLEVKGSPVDCESEYRTQS
jgi:hypothetical protein